VTFFGEAKKVTRRSRNKSSKEKQKLDFNLRGNDDQALVIQKAADNKYWHLSLDSK